MTWAADAASPKDPAELAATECAFIGRYLGTAYQRYGFSRAEADGYLDHGVGVLVIFEEWASQFLGGFDVAVQMMDRMRLSWHALGIPDTVIPAIVLVDPSPGAVPGNEGALIDFARGIESRLWTSEWTAYGSKYGLDVVRASGVAPRLTRRWGVGTWGFGEGPAPHGALPPGVDADLIQHGNRAAPVGGTDYNTMLRPDMGQWGGPVSTPPASSHAGRDRMILYVANAVIPGHGVGRFMQGNLIVRELTDALNEYGVPISASNWRAAVDPTMPIAFLTGPFDSPAWDALQQGHDALLAIPPGVPGEPPEDLTTVARDEWAGETNRRLGADELEIQGGTGNSVVVV